MGVIGKIFIGLGIVVGFLLVFTAVVAFSAVDRAMPIVEQEYPTHLLRDERSCADPCSNLETIHTFSPPEGARVLVVSLGVAMEPAGGVVQVRVVDPTGGLVLERTYTGSTEPQTHDEDASFTPREGEWRYTLSTAAFQGSVVFDAWTRGIPDGSLR